MLLRFFSVVFSSFLENRLWNAINDSFGFTKTKTSNVFDGLDYSDFLSTSVFKDDVVFALFVGCGSTSVSSRTSNSDSCSSWLDGIEAKASA